MMSSLVVFFIIKIIVSLSSGAELTQFGFTTSNRHHAGTSATIEVTFWFNYTIFSCSIKHPNEPIAWYYCDAIGKTWSDAYTTKWSSVDVDRRCNYPEYKMLIDNSHSSDTLFIDGIGIWINNERRYRQVLKFCLPNTAHTSLAPIVDDTICASDESPHEELCIDNNSNSCAPGKQLLIFDDLLNAISTSTYGINVEWRDGTNTSTEPLNCTTLAPAYDPTQIPAMDPTWDPTRHPTSTPTFDPTPTPLSMEPTNNPTLITPGPTQSPILTTQITLAPTYEPTMEPTISSTRESTQIRTTDGALYSSVNMESSTTQRDHGEESTISSSVHLLPTKRPTMALDKTVQSEIEDIKTLLIVLISLVAVCLLCIITGFGYKYVAMKRDQSEIESARFVQLMTTGFNYESDTIEQKYDVYTV